MPFSIIPNQDSFTPSESRRTWLKRSITSFGALALGRFAPAAIARANAAQPWVAFVSDTHIAADPTKTNHQLNMTNNLTKVIAQILAEPVPPQAVLIDGDLALADGQKGDYVQLMKLLAPLTSAGIAIHLALGNHDNRENFREILGDSALIKSGRITAIESHHTSDLTIAGVRFLILDSLQRPNFTPGAIGTDQAKWLTETLAQHVDTPTIVYVHHNPDLKTDKALSDTQRLYDAILPSRQVKAVVFGHTHVWNPKGQHEGVKLINIPAVGYPHNPIQPIGWTKFVPIQGGAELTLSSLDPTHAAHGVTQLLNWR